MKKFIVALVILVAVALGYYLYSQKKHEHPGTPVSEEQTGTSVTEGQSGTETGTPGEEAAPSEGGEEQPAGTEEEKTEPLSEG